MNIDEQMERTLRREEVLGKEKDKKKKFRPMAARGFRFPDIQKAAEESRADDAAIKEHENPYWDKK